MSVASKPAVPALAIFAVTISLTTSMPDSAANAAECLSGPKGAAPAGSHWKYRIERSTNRKCWRLVAKDGGPAPQAAQTEPEESDAASASSAPAVPAPSADSRAPRTVQAEAVPAPTPEPVIRTLVTRNVSNPSDAAQPLPPQDAATSTAPRETAAAPAPLEQKATELPAPAPLAQAVPTVTAAAPQPVAVADTTADAESAPTLKLLLLAIALIGFAACAAFLVMAAMRRRADVLNRAHDNYAFPQDASLELEAETTSPDIAPTEAALAQAVRREDAPTFAPIPPIGMATREDDVDQALQRFEQRRRRRAA